jgi:type VI secretion system protein ImpM
MAGFGSVTEGVTLLGKTPARPDFVRINHGSPSALALDEWLQRNLEELVLGGQRTAPASRFLFAPQGGGEALCGLLAPSRDKAGRSFPVALFTALPASLAQRRPHAVLLGAEPFIAAARALFDRLVELDYEALKAAVAAIDAPLPDAYEAADKESDAALAQVEPGPWVERLFRDSADGVAGAALLAVSSGERETAPKSAVLECPVHEVADALFWLALARRGAQQPLSFFWTEVATGEPPASRLLLGAAPPPVQTLLHLSAGKPKPGRLQLLSGPTARAQPQSREAAQVLLEKLLGSRSLGEFVGAVS